jgi:hypothetical protein
MYDASSDPSRQRRMSRATTALDEVVLETRCQRCRSLILCERIDPCDRIPILDEHAQIICASCSTPEGRHCTS